MLEKVDKVVSHNIKTPIIENPQVQWCGGKVIRETGTKMTHLVAANSMGEKYQ